MEKKNIKEGVKYIINDTYNIPCFIQDWPSDADHNYIKLGVEESTVILDLERAEDLLEVLTKFVENGSLGEVKNSDTIKRKSNSLLYERFKKKVINGDSFIERRYLIEDHLGNQKYLYVGMCIDSEPAFALRYRLVGVKTGIGFSLSNLHMSDDLPELGLMADDSMSTVMNMYKDPIALDAYMNKIFRECWSFDPANPYKDETLDECIIRVVKSGVVQSVKRD